MTNNSPEFPVEEIEELGSASKSGLNIALYRRTLQRKAWLIGGLTGLTTVAALIWSFFDPSIYEGSFYLLVEPITSAAKLSDPSTVARTGGVPTEDLFNLDYPTNLAFLQSPGMTNRIAQKVQEVLPDKSVAAIWKDLRDNFTVTRVGGESRATATKIFAVSYQGKSVKEVQTILDTAASTFLKYSSEDRETSLKSGVKFIDRQLPSLQKRLADLQIRQKKLRERYDLLDPTIKGQEVLTRVQEISKEQQDVANQLKAQKSLHTSLQKQLSLTPKQALDRATLSQDPERIALTAKLQEIESQIAVESARFTTNSPILKTLEEQRQNFRRLLAQKTQTILKENSLDRSTRSNAQNPIRLKLIEQLIDANSQIQMLEVRNRSLLATKNDLEVLSKQYPRIIGEYQDINRQIALTTGILDRLQTQRETLKVESAQDLPWQLISKPQIPLDRDGNPISSPPPNRVKKLAAGFGGGLLLSTLLAFFLEKRRNVFYAAGDLPVALSLPLMGEIPHDDTESIEEGSLPVRSFAFETAFHTLYTRLLLGHRDKPIHSLVICSVEGRDGQTTFALNLARVAATTGKKVLLVDANWHNPQLHKWLNLPNQKGLYQVLNSAIDPIEVIQSMPDNPKLSILTAGIDQPLVKERLWSTIMQEVMTTLASKYDLVIYDVPHFFDSTDVSFLIDRSDGMLLLVNVAKTRATQVKKACQDLDKFSLPCLGVVAHLSPAPPPLL